MRVLLDTNVVVSALLFGGHPRELLRLLCDPLFELWTSRPLLRELGATLSHPKLAPALERTEITVERLVQAYAAQALVVPDHALSTASFPEDPSDADVIAAAEAAAVDWLVSGDHHLLGNPQVIPGTVLSVTDALTQVRALLASS
jgi:putative PIN family toxin of toxin-antitoxin system